VVVREVVREGRDSVGHKLIDTKFAFADRLMIPDGELLGTVRFRHDAAEESAADAFINGK